MRNLKMRISAKINYGGKDGNRKKALFK
jgi:hypothetical protein